jgi:hypothetical protein
MWRILLAMPRKSVSSLTIVAPLLPGEGRPPPPVELDVVEAGIWRAVTDSLPSHWLDPAGQTILRNVAVQGALAERLGDRLRALHAQDLDASEEAAALAIEHREASKAVAHLLTTLRATPRSRAVPRQATARIAEAPRARRPWDIRAEDA